MRRDVFQAIADPTRRSIIALLAAQAMSPSAIAEHFSMTRQAISKHMKILTECALVQPEQLGREILYRLEVEKIKEVDAWIAPYRSMWETSFNQLDNLLTTIKNKQHDQPSGI